MAPIIYAAAFAAAMASADALTSKQGQKLLKVQEAIKGDYIVALHKSSAKNLPVFGARFNATLVYDSLPSFPGFAASLDQDQLETLLSSPAVKFVEEDSLAYAIQSDPQEQCPDAQTELTSWGQARTTVESISDGLDTFYYDSVWGTGVDIYLIDTGSNCNHEEFTEGECECGPSFCGGVDGCSDGNGHGSHCASTAAGQRYGIAKSAKMIGVKVLSDSGSGAYSSVIGGVNYAAEQSIATGRPSVASLSLGGGICNSLNAAVDAAVEAGCAMAVAAGNDNRDACNYSPASSELAVTVGATTRTDARSSFSNIGNCVDVFAPGSDITAAWTGGNSTYNTISGTSMACPHVAGAIAALFSIDPSLSAMDVKETLKVIALKDVISNVGANSPNELLHLECTDSLSKAPTATPKCLFQAASSLEGDSMLEVAGTDQDACCDLCDETNGCAAFVFEAEIGAGSEFEIARTGTCETATNGRCATITDVEGCVAGGAVLFPGLSVYTESDSGPYPTGCYNFLGYNLYQNSATNTRGDCGNYECVCECEAIPATPATCRLFAEGAGSIVDAEDHIVSGVLNF